MGVVLDDQEAARRLDAAEAAADAIGEARACVRGVETLALAFRVTKRIKPMSKKKHVTREGPGPAFDDTVTVLYIFGEQLGAEAQAAGGAPLAEDVVLAKIDDLLALLGLAFRVTRANKKMDPPAASAAPGGTVGHTKTTG